MLLKGGRRRENALFFLSLLPAVCQTVAISSGSGGSGHLWAHCCSSNSGIRRLRADADSDGCSEHTPCPGLLLCPVVLLEAAALQSDL